MNITPIRDYYARGNSIPGREVKIPLSATAALDGEVIDLTGYGVMLIETQPLPIFQVEVEFDAGGQRFRLMPNVPLPTQFSRLTLYTNMAAGLAGKHLRLFVAMVPGIFPTVGSTQEGPLFSREAACNDVAQGTYTLNAALPYASSTGGKAYRWAREVFFFVEGPGKLCVSMQHNFFANANQATILQLAPRAEPYRLPIVVPAELTAGTTYYHWSAAWDLISECTFRFAEYVMTGR